MRFDLPSHNSEFPMMREESNKRDLSPEKILPTQIRDILASTTPGSEVEVSGTVLSIRDQKNRAFIVLGQGNDQVQVVVEKSIVPDFTPPSRGSFITVTGEVVENQNTKTSNKEIIASQIDVVSTPSRELVLESLAHPPKLSLDTALDNRSEHLRNVHIQSIFKVNSIVARSFQDTMEELGFTQIFSPKILGGGSEGGAEVFTLDYFGQTASLAQSPQLYKQISAAAFGGVYEIGPVFRAENSQTSRHLTEFTGLDFEVSHVESVHQLMDIEEKFIRKMFSDVAEKGAAALATSNHILDKVPDDIPRLTFKEATALIEEAGTQSDGRNFDQAIGKAVMDKFNSPFVFIYEYPRDERPFYTKPLPNDPEHTQSFDLIYKGIELSSGAIRINTVYELKESMIAKGLDPENYPGYIAAYELGMPNHGGGGMGLQRITQQILGLENVREATLFPRDTKRLAP